MKNQLLTEVVEATGLPPEMVNKELTKMLMEAGLDPQTITLDQLRDVLAVQIGEALLQVKEEITSEVKFSGN